MLYRLSRWNQFFGNAQFYRYKRLNSESKFKEHFSDTIIALEILALAKHCQWKAAVDLGKSSLQASSRLDLKNQRIQTALQYIYLHRAFPKEIIPKSDHQTPRSFFASTTLWKLKKRQLDNIDHPRKIRVLVQNHCSQTNPDQGESFSEN